MTARAHTACLYCRTNRKRCTGGPPCQNCVDFAKETCEFVLTAASRKRVVKHIRNESGACGACRTKTHSAKEDRRVESVFNTRRSVHLRLVLGARSTSRQGTDRPACGATPRRSAVLAKEIRVEHVPHAGLKVRVSSQGEKFTSRMRHL